MLCANCAWSVNALGRRYVELTFCEHVIFLGKQYMCNPTYLWMFLDNCAWIYHLHGDCCRQTVHGVKLCECFSLFWANNSTLWTFVNVFHCSGQTTQLCEHLWMFLDNCALSSKLQVAIVRRFIYIFVIAVTKSAVQECKWLVIAQGNIMNQAACMTLMQTQVNISLDGWQHTNHSNGVHKSSIVSI